MIFDGLFPNNIEKPKNYAPIPKDSISDSSRLSIGMNSVGKLCVIVNDKKDEQQSDKKANLIELHDDLEKSVLQYCYYFCVEWTQYLDDTVKLLDTDSTLDSHLDLRFPTCLLHLTVTSIIKKLEDDPDYIIDSNFNKICFTAACMYAFRTVTGRGAAQLFLLHFRLAPDVFISLYPSKTTYRSISDFPYSVFYSYDSEASTPYSYTSYLMIKQKYSCTSNQVNIQKPRSRTANPLMEREFLL